ncbi:Vps54-domain-containing protein [Rhizopus microsporus var. microsporus]|uniref:Vacuolar protein sorting-associated protein 54 n=1 Tax=Rhizopus microsporus var. microsporus TaxID=86635 RepID=A0A1X0R296_RHIZD|nr:Vps54-domain-containing protein [Rhizopus microsporus var. microsporus]
MPSNASPPLEASSESTFQKASTSANTSQSTSPVNTNTPTIRPLARERPYAREEYNNNNNNNSRPPSIRSAASYGRTLSRLTAGHHARHHSNYSSFSTISENVLPWTTQDIGFNAISGVLNDPAKRSQDVYKPTKADIPPVAHATIPRIRPTDFETYLSHIGPVFERYSNNRKLLNAAIQEQEEEEEQQAQAISKRGRNPYSLPPQHILSSESLLDDDVSKTPPRELPMLENVPPIFFEPDFLLENPQVFDTVCEGANIVESNSGPVLTILQEKLSYYLDTVEIHLLREIENRSSSFFEALSNLQALHQQTVDCISQIHTIRQKMKRIQDTECKDGLEVIRLQVRKRNLEKLYNITMAVKSIRAVQPTVQALLTEGDYFAALDLIQTTKDALADPEQGLDGIKSLANFSSELDEMQKSVSIMMQHDFLSLLLSDFSFHLNNVKKELTMLDVQENTIENDLSEKLLRNIKGLIRTDTMMSTLQNYKERLLVEIKDIVRKRHPLGGTTDASEQGFTRQLKAMPFVSFFQMLLNVLSILIQAILRASAYHTLFTPHLSPELEQESSDVVSAVAELAQAQCRKLIVSRNEQNALLNPTDFYRLSHVLDTFVAQCEVYSGGRGLRSLITSQQRSFVDHFHMERVKQETQLIENEQWAVSEVPFEFQTIVNQLCEGNVAHLVDETGEDKQEKSSKKHLVIDGQSFYVVGCTLLILKMFQDYTKCVYNLENIAIDIVQKLIELLKLFNSRVCQVILGAGAMQSAGLKNITAKHLALASQSIGVMIVLIPKLNKCIYPLIEQNNSFFSEFDRIVKDYSNHQSEIHKKLVAIMNERFNAHVKSMQSIEWDEEEEIERKANTYMETLVTETIRLHKVLSKYLPVDELKVNRKCKDQLIADTYSSLLCLKYLILFQLNSQKRYPILS